METNVLAVVEINGMCFERTAESEKLVACVREAQANGQQEVADGYLDALVAKFYAIV